MADIRGKARRAAAHATRSSHSGSVLVLDKAWAILDCFTGRDAELTSKQVREQCRFPATTTSRLIANLVEGGLLSKSGDLLRIGSRVLAWSEAARRALDLIPLLTPLLVRLRDRTGESAALYQPVGLKRVCVAVVETRKEVIWQLRVGLTTPLHIGSGGRAILAFDTELYDRATRQSLNAFTDDTITDPTALDRALEETRRIGAAVSTGELTSGVAGVSAPVFGMEHRPVASLGVAGPLQRFDTGSINAFIPAVLNIASEASSIMSGRA